MPVESLGLSEAYVLRPDTKFDENSSTFQGFPGKKPIESFSIL